MRKILYGYSHDGQIKTNADTSGELDRCRNGASEPLAKPDESESNKHETLHEHGSEGNGVRDKTRSVESNNSVGKVRVETHTGCKSDGPIFQISAGERTPGLHHGNTHIGKETHAEGGQGRDCGSGGDEIAFDAVDTLQVGLVGGAQVRHALRRTDARSSRVGQDGRVDGDDVGHCEEGREAGADLCEEARALALSALHGCYQHRCSSHRQRAVLT